MSYEFEDFVLESPDLDLNWLQKWFSFSRIPAKPRRKKKTSESISKWEDGKTVSPKYVLQQTARRARLSKEIQNNSCKKEIANAKSLATLSGLKETLKLALVEGDVLDAGEGRVDAALPEPEGDDEGDA